MYNNNNKISCGYTAAARAVDGTRTYTDSPRVTRLGNSIAVSVFAAAYGYDGAACVARRLLLRGPGKSDLRRARTIRRRRRRRRWSTYNKIRRAREKHARPAAEYIQRQHNDIRLPARIRLWYGLYLLLGIMTCRTPWGGGGRPMVFWRLGALGPREKKNPHRKKLN